MASTGRLPSPGHKMVYPRPVVHPFAEELWNQLFPVQPNDGDLDWPLLRFCHAVTLPLHLHADVVLDRPEAGPMGTTMPGWAVLMSPSLCPVAFLPYLAQFKGVRMLDGLTEEAMRLRIVETDGFDRGKPSSLIGAARQFLIPETPNTPARVILRERYHPDFPNLDMEDDITIITYRHETPGLIPIRWADSPANTIPIRWDSPVIRRALLEQKPVGDRLHYYVLDYQDYQVAIDSGRTYAESALLYPLYSDRSNDYQEGS